MNDIYYDIYVDNQLIFRVVAEFLPMFLKCYVDIMCENGLYLGRKIEIKEVENNE